MAITEMNIYGKDDSKQGSADSWQPDILIIVGKWQD